MRRTVLITGVAQGIGKATAQYFHDRGWQVIGGDQRTLSHNVDTMTFHKLDLASSDSIHVFSQWLVGQGVELDALVNNAAVQITKPLIETTQEEWDQTLTTNLTSLYVMATNLFPILKKGKSAVVNVASVHALATSKGIAAYAASKGGAMALTRAMALEFAQNGIRVNAVLPGAVDTDMLRAGLNRGRQEGESVEDRMARLASSTPLGRVGDPVEIASVVYFLADHEQSGFMTGAGLVVDGGATAHLSTE